MVETEVVPVEGTDAMVRVVRINRPERRNAIDTDTATALHEAFLAFEAASGERVAVLTGDEQAFCAGADLTDLPRLRPSGPLGPTRLQLSKPVVAAVESWCVAGGLELALWCDLRVAGRGTRFGCLASSIAAHPWACVVADRRSVYDGIGADEATALAAEAARGREVILADDFAAGVEQFRRR